MYEAGVYALIAQHAGYFVLLLSDKSFLIDMPFFWRGQKVKG